MIKVSYQMKGAAEFDTMLRELPGAVANRVANNALRAGARVVQKAAVRMVPVETGELKANIKVRTRKPKNPHVKAVSVGVRGKEAPLAHLVEFGTAPHKIEAPAGKKLVFVGKDGRKVAVAEVQHPGAAPRPFLRPATDTSIREAVDKIGETLGKGIEREAVNLASRVAGMRSALNELKR